MLMGQKLLLSRKLSFSENYLGGVTMTLTTLVNRHLKISLAFSFYFLQSLERKDSLKSKTLQKRGHLRVKEDGKTTYKRVRKVVIVYWSCV